MNKFLYVYIYIYIWIYEYMQEFDLIWFFEEFLWCGAFLAQRRWLPGVDKPIAGGSVSVAGAAAGNYRQLPAATGSLLQSDAIQWARNPRWLISIVPNRQSRNRGGGTHCQRLTSWLVPMCHRR